MAAIVLGINLGYSGLKSVGKRIIYLGTGLFTLFYAKYHWLFFGMALCALFIFVEIYWLYKGKYDYIKKMV